MSIPLDRLYNYIETTAEKIRDGSVVIYRFLPHGSKKIEDLKPLRWPDYVVRSLSPEVFCNDQEPLNFDLYRNHSREVPAMTKIRQKKNIHFESFNLRGEVLNIWDQALLIHSEQHSKQIEMYKNCNFLPVYYWSHAVISRDWFRYAEHVEQHKQIQKLFLIYNRAWSGTREYRLKFSDLLVEHNLCQACQTSVNPVDSTIDQHYRNYNFVNPQWCPNHNLEKYFAVNTATSNYSADFDIQDYEQTEIEIVLETLFDDHRWHLTEKTLRPVACGQPFILAATAGSLKYLQQYGFRTFHEVWDETYDTVTDPETRLAHIVDLMTTISQWDPETKTKKMQQANQIAQYNKQHFFSQQFEQQVHNELEQNLKSAFVQLEDTNTAWHWLNRRWIGQQHPEFVQENSKNKNPGDSEFVESVAKRYYERNLSKNAKQNYQHLKADK